VAAKQFFRERIFEKTFHCTAHWARAILRIVSFFDQKFLRTLLQLDVDVFGLDPGEHFVGFKIDDAQ